MKTRFYTQTLIALAVAVAAAASAVSQAQEQPIPPPVNSSALPADIVPGTPLAEVVKLIQSGVDVSTINTYIVNSQSAFNLDADKIIFLKDEGAPSELVNAMLERDKILYASTITPQPAPAQVSSAASSPDTAPPPTEVTVNYFNDTLSPYGSWVQVEGYGRCWRPTVMNYDTSWRPYCDRGHWVYTDYGWYWDSDYSWGSTFHYGRWFRHSSFGWCWYPDTVWAPSWVTWRSGGEYCGWAPLPPLAVFRPGFGFFYRGASVAVGFDFGLDAGCFTFVSQNRFYDRHPRYYAAEPHRATQIFHQTTVINNFNSHDTRIVNNGISVQQVSTGIHHPIEPVHIGSLPNAGRHGWRGDGFDRPRQQGAAGNNNNSGPNVSSGSGQVRHGPAIRNDQNNGANPNRHPNIGQPGQVPNQGGNQAAPPRSLSPDQPGNRIGQRDRAGASRNLNPQAQQQNVNPPANNNNNNNGQVVNRIQRPNNPQVMGNGNSQQSQQVTPRVTPVVREPRQVQNILPPGGNNSVQSQPQPRQFNARVTPDRSVPQNDWRQNRSAEPPAAGVRPQHSIPQAEPRQFVAPSAPSMPSQPSAPRSYTPPPQPAPSAPAPAPSQPRSADRGSDRGQDKDRQNR